MDCRLRSAAESGLQVAGCGLWSADCRLQRNPGCGTLSADCGMQVADCGVIQLAVCGLQIEGRGARRMECVVVLRRSSCRSAGSEGRGVKRIPDCGLQFADYGASRGNSVTRG
eukprot:14147103-Alexandrium_andersonii.AAC.1